MTLISIPRTDPIVSKQGERGILDHLFNPSSTREAAAAAGMPIIVSPTHVLIRSDAGRVLGCEEIISLAALSQGIKVRPSC